MDWVVFCTCAEAAAVAIADFYGSAALLVVLYGNKHLFYLLKKIIT